MRSRSLRLVWIAITAAISASVCLAISLRAEDPTEAESRAPYRRRAVWPENLGFSTINLSKGPATRSRSFVIRNTGTGDLSVTIGSLTQPLPFAII